jgi:hypothetical protein
VIVDFFCLTQVLFCLLLVFYALVKVALYLVQHFPVLLYQRCKLHKQLMKLVTGAFQLQYGFVLSVDPTYCGLNL